MAIRCVGCGEILQNEHENEKGYTPKLEDVKYCQRCFRMMHYNELPKVLAEKEDYLKVVDHVLKQNGLMILVVDIFAFTTSFSQEIIDKLRDQDVILVVNKIDLLPKSININDILNFVSKECEKQFFRVIAIHMASAQKGYYLDELMNTIDLCRRGRNVYILGVANVGKSTFINALLKRFTSRTTDVIATSLIPGTTLDEIVIPFFDDNKAFIDTPGLINDEYILHHIDLNDYTKVLPKGEIRPLTYQVFGDYTYFIGGLGYITFTNAKDISAVFYISRELDVTRVRNDKLSHTLNERLGKSILPVSKDPFVVEEMVCHNKTNIFFSGFGFVTITGSTKVKVGYLKGTKVKRYGNILSNRKK